MVWKWSSWHCISMCKPSRLWHWDIHLHVTYGWPCPMTVWAFASAPLALITRLKTYHPWPRLHSQEKPTALGWSWKMQCHGHDCKIQMPSRDSDLMTDMTDWFSVYLSVTKQPQCHHKVSADCYARCVLCNEFTPGKQGLSFKMWWSQLKFLTTNSNAVFLHWRTWLTR